MDFHSIKLSASNKNQYCYGTCLLAAQFQRYSMLILPAPFLNVGDKVLKMYIYIVDNYTSFKFKLITH